MVLAAVLVLLDARLLLILDNVADYVMSLDGGVGDSTTEQTRLAIGD